MKLTEVEDLKNMVSWRDRGDFVVLSFFGGSEFCEYIDVNALSATVDERLNHST